MFFSSIKNIEHQITIINPSSLFCSYKFDMQKEICGESLRSSPLTSLDFVQVISEVSLPCTFPHEDFVFVMALPSSFLSGNRVCYRSLFGCFEMFAPVRDSSTCFCDVFTGDMNLTNPVKSIKKPKS